MARHDPHSYHDTDQPQVASIDWRARVDFAARVLDASVTLVLAQPAPGGPIDLDTRDLTIAQVTAEDGSSLKYELGAPDPILGARLRVELLPGARRFTVKYRTAPGASALQWLSPEQTQGRQHPFLFSQCQAIHARSVVPVPDTPRVRITFDAQLRVPSALRGLMAAAFVGRELAGEEAIEKWTMPQPIPPYLIAFAVGDLVSRELGPRSRVWAEPAIVDAAAWEFHDVDKMLTTAEALFGPYVWDRFDILTMPPSFPYGGMENPRLTFLTPTLLAGDRSLVTVLAHELAHSWTGNLVTNASAEHFWLNEGWTVFAERRILEALEGEELCALHAALGRRSLDRAVARMASHPEWTRLRTHLDGIDPDEVFSEVPYEKGYLFLRTLEDTVGRERFSLFVRRYVDTFKFQSLTTEEFADFVERELPGALAKARAAEWFHEGGVPSNAPVPRSARLEVLAAHQGELPPADVAATWKPIEWQLYLESLPSPVSPETCRALDEKFQLTTSHNYEVLVAWLVLAAESGYEPALGRIGEVLGIVGRMKYLKPLYTALGKREETKPLARECFESYCPTYHPIAQQVVANLLSK